MQNNNADLTQIVAGYEKDSSSSYRSLRLVIPAALGHELILLKTAAFTTGVAGLAIVGASLVGLPVTGLFWSYFSKGLSQLMSKQSNGIKMPVMFLFHASMAILSGFIGLAIVTACTAALSVNPFTLPCLIAVAIASTIALTVALAVMYRTRYYATKNRSTLTELPWRTLKAAAGFADGGHKPFQTDVSITRSKLVVIPLGAETEPMISSESEVELEKRTIGQTLRYFKGSFWGVEKKSSQSFSELTDDNSMTGSSDDNDDGYNIGD